MFLTWHLRNAVEPICTVSLVTVTFSILVPIPCPKTDPFSGSHILWGLSATSGKRKLENCQIEFLDIYKNLKRKYSIKLLDSNKNSSKKNLKFYSFLFDKVL